MPRADPPAVLIVNAYSVGNWGDSAIVEATIDLARRAGFGRIVVASSDAGVDDERWKDLGADAVVPALVEVGTRPASGLVGRLGRLAVVLGRYVRYRLRLVPDASMRAYRAADVVIAAGGGYLGGRKSGVNLVKAMNIRAAHDAGRPTIVAPVTVNPSSRPVRWLLRWGLAGARTYARDAPSEALLRGLGVETAFTPDVALVAPSLRAARATATAGRDSTGTIAWAPRGYRADHAAWGDPMATQAAIQGAVTRMLESTDRRLRMIAHVHATDMDDDQRAIDAIVAAFPPALRDRIAVEPAPTDLPSAVDRYRHVDLLISSRMHAAIFAMAVGTPALTVAYEPKVQGVLGDLGLADRVLAVDGRVDADSVGRSIERLLLPAERTRTLATFDAASGRFAGLSADLVALRKRVETS